MESRESLDAGQSVELRRRLRALEEPPHSTSECFGSTRSVLRQGLLWVAAAAGVWVATVIFL